MEFPYLRSLNLHEGKATNTSSTLARPESAPRGLVQNYRLQPASLAYGTVAVSIGHHVPHLLSLIHAVLRPISSKLVRQETARRRAAKKKNVATRTLQLGNVVTRTLQLGNAVTRTLRLGDR